MSFILDFKEYFLEQENIRVNLGFLAKYIMKIFCHMIPLSHHSSIINVVRS